MALMGIFLSNTFASLPLTFSTSFSTAHYCVKWLSQTIILQEGGRTGKHFYYLFKAFLVEKGQ